MLRGSVLGAVSIALLVSVPAHAQNKPEIIPYYGQGLADEAEVRTSTGSLGFKMESCPTHDWWDSKDGRMVSVTLGRRPENFEQRGRLVDALLAHAATFAWRTCPHAAYSVGQPTGDYFYNISQVLIVSETGEELISAALGSRSFDMHGDSALGSTSHGYVWTDIRNLRAEHEASLAQLKRETAAAAAAEEIAQQQRAAQIARQKAAAEAFARLVGLALFGGFLWLLWLGRRFIYGLIPQSRAAWQEPDQPPMQSSQLVVRGEPVMSDDQDRRLVPQGARRPLVRSHDPLPPAPLGVPLFGVLRNSWDKKQVESYTELENAISEHLAALRRQLDLKGELLTAEAEWAGKAVALPKLQEIEVAKVEQKAAAVRREAELAADEHEVRKARLKLELARINKAATDLQNPAAASPQTSDAERLTEVFKHVRELEAAFDAHVAQIIKEAGGEDQLTDDARRHIDHVEMLKATKVADFYESMA